MLNLFNQTTVKPTEVKIVDKSSISLKENEKQVIECQVFGSKPSAKVRWFKGSEELFFEESSQLKSRERGYVISELNRDMSVNNLTKISYLTVHPRISDNQQSLTCMASNAKLTNSPSISDSMIMNVQC